MTGQGRQFIDWWAERLRSYCYDEVENGLFTDQRWVDLAPAFFDDIAIVREPQYNVATWNLTHRRATGRAPYEIEINGRPLVFYHFSGFDSGAQKVMLDRYGYHSPVLFDLRDWYIARCEELGQSTLSKIDCVYNSFSNGERITSAQRLLYRRRPDLMPRFPTRLTRVIRRRSYLHWYRMHGWKRQCESRDEDHPSPRARAGAAAGSKGAFGLAALVRACLIGGDRHGRFHRPGRPA